MSNLNKFKMLLPVGARASSPHHLASFNMRAGSPRSNWELPRVKVWFSRILVILISLIAIPLFAESALISADKTIQITLPDGWQQDRELNDNAQLQAADRVNGNYVIVISENKNIFTDMTLEKHSDITRAIVLKHIEKPTVEGPAKLTIDGNPAIQYVIRGTVFGVAATYVHTTIETKKRYHQILAWTLRVFDRNIRILQQVTKTFKENPDGLQNDRIGD